MHVNPLRTWSRLSPSYTTDADAGRTSGQAPSPLSLSGTKSQVELSSWVPISHGQWESLIGRVTWDSDCWLVATLMCPALPVCLYRTHTKPFLLLVSCPTVLTLNLHLPSRVNHEHLMLKLLRIKASYPDTSASIFRYFRHSISTPGMSFILSIHCAFMWRTQLKNLYLEIMHDIKYPIKFLQTGLFSTENLAYGTMAKSIWYLKDITIMLSTRIFNV